MSVEKFPFFAEVRITSSPSRPELEGRLGGVLGVSERVDENGHWIYAVAPDECDELLSFRADQLALTGHLRRSEDYY